MSVVVRADVEAMVINLLQTRLTDLPQWLDRAGNPWPAVSSETPAGWGEDWANLQPFVTVAQAGTRPQQLCHGSAHPAPKERATLQINCYGSGRAPQDTPKMVNPLTAAPFKTTKAEAQYLAQCVASVIETCAGYTAFGGSLESGSTANKLWVPENKGDRSRYIVTARVTSYTPTALGVN